MKKRHKQTSKPERRLASDGKFCVQEIYRKEKRTVYHVRGAQAKHVPEIALEGFIGIPPGLYLNRNGFGFGKKGVFLLAGLSRDIAGGKKLEFVIADGGSKSARSRGASMVVRLPMIDVKNLLIRLGRINEDSNSELRSAVSSFLSTKFPTRVKTGATDFDEYKAGEMAAMLRRRKVSEKLNEEDLESLKAFFPEIFKSSLKGKKRGIKVQRGKLIRDTKRVTDTIFLDEVIKEFDGLLKKKTLPESSWQEFLSEKVFRFVANYVTTIEKQNVSVAVSYPDFVLVDVYGFVDVFEIKRHDTELLALDESHDNYYWKPEIAKAISQIENYTDEITRNANDYIRAVKRKKGLDIRVVRPRGYIIAGQSNQFGNKKESSDFRKLGGALRNISFVLYDELLANLKNLRSKL